MILFDDTTIADHIEDDLIARGLVFTDCDECYLRKECVGYNFCEADGCYHQPEDKKG